MPAPAPHRQPMPLSILSLLLLFLLSLAPTVGAQKADTGKIATGIPTLDAIQSRIADLEVTNGSEAEASKALENYRQTLAQLELAKKEETQAQLYKEAVDQAGEQLAKLRKQLKKLTNSGPLPVLPKRLTVTELTRLHNQAQSERQFTQTQIRELQDKQAAQRLRPEQSGIELAETKRQIETVDARLATETATGIAAHQKTLLLANQSLLKNKAYRLEMERLSHGHRMEQLSLQFQLHQAQLKQHEQSVQQLQERISTLQTKEAEQAQDEAQKAQEKAAGKHPLIQKYADNNAELSRTLAQLVTDVEATVLRREKTLSRKESIRQSQERVQQQIIIGGMDDQLGRLLQRQRSILPKAADINRAVETRRTKIAASRPESFQIEDRRQKLQEELDLKLIAEQMPADLTETDWLAIRQEIRLLLENRLQLLDKLQTAYSRYEKALADLSAEQLQLYDRVEQYGALLDRHLLWIPSTTQLSGETLSHSVAALGWLLSADNWRSVFNGIISGLTQYPLRIVILIIVLAILLYSRPKMYQTLAEIAPSVGNVTHDTFLHTVKAFAITLLLALPWPLLMAAMGWWLTKGSDQPFIIALATGLRRLAPFFFIIQIVRYLFIQNGLALIHFRWDSTIGDYFQRHLRWLVPVLIPLAFTVGVFEWVEEESYTNALGRLASIAGLIVTALFFHRVLNPWSGFPAAIGERQVSRFWYPATLLICLTLVILAFEGYYYSALNLERMLFLSLFSGIFVFLSYHLLSRGLLVAERRLALSRARVKRQAVLDARLTKEAADAAGEGIPELAEFEEVNLATINEQTRRMLRIGASLLFATLLYLVWEQLTPALGWLNESVLWQFKSSGGEISTISTWDSLLALTVLILTLIAGRNLPGLLEIALLQPMNLALGNRYAVSTISRYTIYTAGTLLVLNLLGLQWDDVQWLVAAMGVGLGFGLKEIFANFFSGIMILFERPIRIGDTVTVGEISGTVSRIRIRATTITDWDNKELVVPNKNFITDPLINWTLTDPITRIIIKVGIAYGSDAELAHQIMMKLIKDHPDVLEEPRPTVFFTSFGDSALIFDIRVFVSEHLKRLPLTHDLHMALNRELANAGIEIPFPQRDLHLKSVSSGITLSGKEGG